MFNLGLYDSPIANIPGTDIHIYSILMAISIIVVVFASWLKMYRRGIPTKTLEGSVLIIVPLGLLGARIWYVLSNTSIVENWVDVFAVWNGGMAIHGGIATGMAVGLFIFYRASKKYRISMWVYLDCILPNILLGQAIGRWGNFFNQEVLGHNIGHPFSWLPGWMNDHLHYSIDPVEVYRQPLFLYESFAALMGWIILTFVIPKVGFWFSKKPWKIDNKTFLPLWKAQPIVKSDYYQPWKLLKKLNQYQRWKKQCWEKAYYDFKPVENEIKDPIKKDFKPLKITSNMNFWQKNNVYHKNFWRKRFHKFSQDSTSLNIAYNPNQYRITYAGVTGSFYFLFYGIIRTIMEPLRDQKDIMMIGPIPTSLVVAVIWIILGIILFIFAQFIASKKFRSKGWFYERQY